MNGKYGSRTRKWKDFFKKVHLARKDWYKNIWSREIMGKIYLSCRILLKSCWFFFKNNAFISL